MIPTLVWIIRVFALRLLFNIASCVPVAVLTKKMRFGSLYKANLAGTCAYVITAPLLAILGFGIWAIVLAHVLESLVVTVLFVAIEPFLPGLRCDRKIAQAYLRYNSNLFISAVVLIVITNGDDTIIGRMLGPAALGFYNIGQQFALLSQSFLHNNINFIIFPVLAQVQHESHSFEKVFFKSYRIVNLLALPLIGGMVVLARAAVRFLFGETWLPIVPVLYILSLAAVLNSFIGIMRPVLKSLNKPHIIRNSHLLELVAFVFLIYPFTSMWGYIGTCWVLVLVSIVPLFYLVPQTSRFIKDMLPGLLRILLKIIICTLVMMFAVRAVTQVLPASGLALLLAVLTGIVVYFSLIIFWDKELQSDIAEVWKIIKSKK